MRITHIFIALYAITHLMPGSELSDKVSWLHYDARKIVPKIKRNSSIFSTRPSMFKSYEPYSLPSF